MVGGDIPARDVLDGANVFQNRAARAAGMERVVATGVAVAKLHRNARFRQASTRLRTLVKALCEPCCKPVGGPREVCRSSRDLEEAIAVRVVHTHGERLGARR